VSGTLSAVTIRLQIRGFQRDVDLAFPLLVKALGDQDGRGARP
jgi:hypothetical protein